VAGSCGRGDEPSGSGATNLKIVMEPNDYDDILVLKMGGIRRYTPVYHT
jgi:hypothetical protein